MSFTEAVRSCLSQYATFSGRARRSEYWFFALASAIATFVGVIILVVIGSVFSAILPDSAANAVGSLLTLVFVVGYIALVIPALAVFVRRMHDTGRSGWWQLLYLTCVGIIVLIVFWALPEKAEGDKYNVA